MSLQFNQVIDIQSLKGKLDSMGLGFEELRRTNPGLIYCSITGFGPDGPSSKRYFRFLSFKKMNLKEILL